MKWGRLEDAGQELRRAKELGRRARGWRRRWPRPRRTSRRRGGRDGRLSSQGGGGFGLGLVPSEGCLPTSGISPSMIRQAPSLWRGADRGPAALVRSVAGERGALSGADGVPCPGTPFRDGAGRQARQEQNRSALLGDGDDT